jgi:hypothetical protein
LGIDNSGVHHALLSKKDLEIKDVSAVQDEVAMRVFGEIPSLADEVRRNAPRKVAWIVAKMRDESA